MTKFWLRSVEAVLLALFLVLALLTWRLSKGPLPLDPLAPYIENALTYMQPNVRLKIGHAALQWQDLGRRPVLTVRDVQARDARGVIAAIPRMEVELALAPLLRGAIVPEQISLANPVLRVARRADGTFAFGLAPADVDPTADAAAEPTAENGVIGNVLIEALTHPASQDNSAGYLQRVAITHSMLVVHDQATNRRWIVPDASLNLERSGADVAISATLPVVDNDRPWTIKANGRYVAASRALDISFDLDKFHPSGISELAAQLHPLRAVDLGLSGKVNMRLALAAEGAKLEQVTFDIKGGEGNLVMPAPVNRAYAVKELTIKGRIAGMLDQITLETLRIALADGTQAGPVLTVTGKGDDLNTAPAIVLDIGLETLTLDMLKRYWPTGAKENTRQWIVKNLDGGSLSESRFHVALGGPRLEDLDLSDLRGSSVLSGIAVTYMKQMPPVENTSAVLSISPKEVAIVLSDGTVPDAQSGKGIRVRNGSVRMTELGSDHERAHVALDLGGEFGEVMRLIDHEPLGYATIMGIDPKTVRGDAVVNLDIAFPLINNLKLDQLSLAVKAKVDGGQIPSVAFGQPLTDSHLSMVLDRKGMDVTGTVALAGIPANLTWRENFGGGEFRSRYDVDATLDNKQRPLVSLTSPIFAAPYVDGLVHAHVVYTSYRDGTGTIESSADLKDAEVAIRQLGWIKPPGEKAHATASATVMKDQLTGVQKFELIAGEAIALAGAATFDGDGALSTLKMTRAHVNDTTVTGEMARDQTGRYQVDVRGKAFNSTYFWKELGRDDNRGSAETQAKTPMTVRAAFDRMWLAKEGDFQDVRLVYSQGRAGIEDIELATNVDGAAPFTFRLGTRDGKRSFHGESANGGGVVRAVGLFNDIVGGKLKIDGDVAQDGSIKGRADIADLKLVQAPLVARLLSVAALTGIVDELNGKGISFKLLRVPFTYAKSTLQISDGEMIGTSLGLTGKGTYSFAESQMNIDGTIVPAYRINSLMSGIPLLGTLLTGGEKGGGIIAATYSYKGDPATAQPSVNPLAALAPGFTRRFFEIFKSKPPQSAATPDKPAKKTEPEPN